MLQDRIHYRVAGKCRPLLSIRSRYEPRIPARLETGLGGVGGFTLIELLVVVAVMATLLAILLPSLARARAAAHMTVELSTGRQLLAAHAMYAGEASGWLLPGFPSQSMVRRGDVRALNHRNERLMDLLAQRYPWRLLPYGDFDIGLLYTDRRVLDGLGATVDFDYRVSLAPRLGLNQALVGGSADKDPTGVALHDSAAVRGTAIQRWGEAWYARRNTDPQRPSDLLVFASADRFVTETGGLIGGYYAVTPPHFGRRLWPTGAPGAGESPNSRGSVALRFSGQAVCAMFDGHAGVLGWTDLQDMRRWAPRATTPD